LTSNACTVWPANAGHISQAPHDQLRQVFARDDSSAQGPALKTVSILIVEDDFLIALQIEAALAEAGLAPLEIAMSSDEAIEMAATHRPELVIMDIRLAGERDGVDTALHLYQNYGIRCIFATAHSDQEVLQRAGPAHPFAWLQKPYTMTSLIAAVQKALAEASGERQ
jgi:CheY-like chemotaxis protein